VDGLGIMQSLVAGFSERFNAMRHMVVRVAALLVFFCLGILSAFGELPQSSAVSKANSEDSYLKLRNIQVGTEVIHVKDFTLNKDAGVFTFRSGAFTLLEPVNGKITGAVFSGDGSFALNSPTNLEKRNLAILTKGLPFEEQFSGAVLRFTDGTEAALRKAAGQTSGSSGDRDGH
jgi:hypothetical protein